MNKFSIGITTSCGHNRAVAYIDPDGFLVHADEAEKAIKQAQIDSLNYVLEHSSRIFQGGESVPVEVIKNKIKELSDDK